MSSLDAVVEVDGGKAMLELGLQFVVERLVYLGLQSQWTVLGQIIQDIPPAQMVIAIPLFIQSSGHPFMDLIFGDKHLGVAHDSDHIHALLMELNQEMVLQGIPGMLRACHPMSPKEYHEIYGMQPINLKIPLFLLMHQD